MKKGVITFFLLIIFYTAQGQTSVYHPFPDRDAVWQLYYNSGCTGLSEYIRECEQFLNGDTLINGINYNKLYENGIDMDAACFGNVYYTYPPYYNSMIGAIREDSSKHIFYNPFLPPQEELLYDFNLQIGDTIPINFIHKDVTQKIFISSIDSIFDGMNYRKRYFLSDSIQGYLFSNYCSIIEGFGSVRGLLNTIDINTFEPPILLLRCFTQNGAIKYSDSSFIFPFPITSACQILSVNDKEFSFEISIYPNPATNKITISGLQLSGKEAVVEIYNMIGEKALVIPLKIKDKKAEVEVSSLSNGIYIVCVNTENNIYRAPFVKE